MAGVSPGNAHGAHSHFHHQVIKYHGLYSRSLSLLLDLGQQQSNLARHDRLPPTYIRSMAHVVG